MKWGLISFNRLTNNPCKSQHQMYKKKRSINDEKIFIIAIPKLKLAFN